MALDLRHKAYQDTLYPEDQAAIDMPRPKATDPRDRQLLLRLTARQFDVLESVAHLERATPNSYAHQVLVEHLSAMADNPRVKADLANRAAYSAGAVAAIPMRRKATRASLSNRREPPDQALDAGKGAVQRPNRRDA